MTDADGEGDAGESGGAGPGRIAGWAGFLAAAALWPPLWFGLVLDVRDGLWICVVTGWCISTTCVLIRSIGHPLVAWATLVCAATAAALWSVALNYFDLPGDPWSGLYQVLIFGKAVINLLVLLLFVYLLRRRARGTPS